MLLLNFIWILKPLLRKNAVSDVTRSIRNKRQNAQISEHPRFFMKIIVSCGSSRLKSSGSEAASSSLNFHTCKSCRRENTSSEVGKQLWSTACFQLLLIDNVNLHITGQGGLRSLRDTRQQTSHEEVTKTNISKFHSTPEWVCESPATASPPPPRLNPPPAALCFIFLAVLNSESPGRVG